MSGFGFPSRKTPSFSSIVALEGIETDCGVWSSAQKLKILGRLRLFRLVVTGVGRLQPASVSCCKHRVPIRAVTIQVSRRDELRLEMRRFCRMLQDVRIGVPGHAFS